MLPAFFLFIYLLFASFTTTCADYELEMIGVELTFSAERLVFGKYEVMDLIPNGRNINVNDGNKHEYVKLIAQHRMTTAIRSQIDAFLDGFYQLVPPDLITIFSPTELELLICGLPDVDIEDLYANTEYHGYQPGDEVIRWFWEAVRDFNKETRNKFLQFITGASHPAAASLLSELMRRGIKKN